MRALAVDDQPLSLEIFLAQVENLKLFDEIQSFTDPIEALEYSKNHPIDIAFLDIIMDEMDGISLAAAIRKYIPNCKVIFTTASGDFALQAFRVHAAGYLVKPVTKEALIEQLEALSIYPVASDSAPEKCLRVQCFGNFEVFDSDGTPLTFRYKKSKELMAYLVHRNGSVCTNAEIASVLYEDKSSTDSIKSQIRNLMADLSKVLQDSNASAAFYKIRGGAAIVPDKIDCDYYGYLENRESVVFGGEYMSQYDWAEDVNAFLNSQH